MSEVWARGRRILVVGGFEVGQVVSPVAVPAVVEPAGVDIAAVAGVAAVAAVGLVDRAAAVAVQAETAALLLTQIPAGVAAQAVSLAVQTGLSVGPFVRLPPLAERLRSPD